MTFAVVLGLLAAVAVVACAIPALRAARVSDAGVARQRPLTAAQEVLDGRVPVLLHEAVWTRTMSNQSDRSLVLSSGSISAPLEHHKNVGAAHDREPARPSSGFDRFRLADVAEEPDHAARPVGTFGLCWM